MFDGRQGLHADRFASLAVFGEARDDLETVEPDESFLRVALAEFTLQDLGIGIADTEGNEGEKMESHLTQWNLPNEMRPQKVQKLSSDGQFIFLRVRLSASFF